MSRSTRDWTAAADSPLRAARSAWLIRPSRSSLEISSGVHLVVNIALGRMLLDQALMGAVPRLLASRPRTLDGVDARELDAEVSLGLELLEFLGELGAAAAGDLVPPPGLAIRAVAQGDRGVPAALPSSL